MNPSDILLPQDRDESKAYLVNKLRPAIKVWRDSGYPNVTNTTKRLLNFWFNEDHIINNEKFEFWYAQRESIETLIYIYEVMKIRKFLDLMANFGDKPQVFDPSTDIYPLYGFKMATGSGKTYVMALSIVWQYFNHKFESNDDYTSKFLLIAGEKNVIYDRLKRDYENGKIFHEIPLIPPEWIDEFNIKVILKEDPINDIPDSVLFLTNVQQLQDKANRKKEADEFIDKVLDLKEVNRTNIAQDNRIKEVLEKIPNIMILKDEAHHIYNYEKKWKQILIDLHRALKSEYGKGFNMELDFSATPRAENGVLFPWLIVDFTLKEAIEMNIVKRPLKGIVQNATEVTSTNVVERYKAWIDAGIRRWQEYNEALAKLNKKPILFFQCPDNKQADQLKEYLETLPQFSKKVLLIHTDSTGEVAKSDIEEARKSAQSIDSDNNNYRVIVSTMMLNEGWDVRNVNVIVGLRSYTSERNVLPEQVIGRGLRKMFPDENASIKDFINILEVIGSPGLMQIIEELEKDENIKFGTTKLENPINIVAISVDLDKKNLDIEIPILTPSIIVREFEINEGILDKIPSLSIKLENKIFKTNYKAFDMVTGAVQVERSWDLPVPQDVKSVIAYYTGKILNEIKLTNMFADLYPIVKEYIEKKLFDQEVNINDPRVLFQISQPEVEEKIIKAFGESMKNLAFINREVDKSDRILISETSPFPWTKDVYQANKCIFNYVPCDNNLEVNFSRFLDSTEDVIAFSKIVQKIGFSIEYRDSEGNLRHYIPDFIIKMQNKYVIAETKGEEDIDVKFKDKRAILWCEDAERVTGDKWVYVRINENGFDKYHFDNFENMIQFFTSKYAKDLDLK
ncbi:type III restriction-modification enzyme subunit R [Candidatus Mancarchaeum acidiphilum]|uniref:Type III restriction-modification enzyme subunit R n=1 Tax=Candidatus Mancarchaeum acidiphilum TaxID=1920749 RepID=A0A218NMU1_9ARCH|nr:DEAD/DEAH box helicase family protein [Candidatus Mancarchaeum acidiphilum]ASI13766.1 type III restriction-modification enzyme subunit R [Candidatus Mancarchaeum acidiphilum]